MSPAMRVAAAASVAVDQSPEAIDHQRVAVAAEQLTKERSGQRIERADRAVAEVADEQVAGELAERRRCDVEAAGQIHFTAPLAGLMDAPRWIGRP